VIVVPHTFGGDLKFNCHLHILISAGGLDESSGRWIPRLRLEKDALMRNRRRAVMDHLGRALKADVLKSDLGSEEVGRLLSIVQARHPRWIIFLDRIASKAHFLRYAARYVRRPPIANWRLLRVSGQHIDFLAKDTRAGGMVRARSRLPDFVRLLAPHVPDLYRHAIRYFGLLAPKAKGHKWAGLFLALSQDMKTPPLRLSWRDSMVRFFGVDPLIDSRGHEMHWVRRERPVIVR
jgi:hypothetical protein